MRLISSRLLIASSAVTMAVFVATPAWAQSPASTLNRAAAKYRSANSMRVKFEQTLTNPLTGKALTSRGELLRKKPNLLSISFTGEKDRIVADGKSLWMYLPSSAPKQVIKLPSGGTPGTLAMVDPLGQVLITPTDQFTLSDAGQATVDDHPTHAVSLTPKDGTGMLFTKATVWIDDKDGTVRKVETTEPGGVTRQIVITKFSPNVDIAKDTFVFVPPTDARVVNGLGR